MLYEDLINNKQNILLRCISGSKAYGLDLPHSDEDIKGIFILPIKDYLGLNYITQINNKSNDITFFEIGKFMELLLKNNPNILELLSTPFDCIMFKHPILELIKPEQYISKLCSNSFAGYAFSQIKKAHGLNKKIINPVNEEKKSVLDFCYIISGNKSIPLSTWLEENDIDQKDCGLSEIAHAKDMLALFHISQFKEEPGFKGIVSKSNSNDISLSSIPKGVEPLGLLSFNKDGYSMYCKDYKEYWDWVKKRNEARYQNTLSYGKNYDSKNMMHVFRLLNMAEEIAVENKINVRRHDREYLLRIRKGEFDYEDLVNQAMDKMENIKQLFEKSDLPNEPDPGLAQEQLIQIREEFYNIYK